MRKTEYWLDLELREDIDDYLTLVYALEQGLDVKTVSIHNPSVNELRLLSYTLRLFKSDADIVLSGHITEYPADKDIHHSLQGYAKLVPTPEPTPLSAKIWAMTEPDDGSNNTGTPTVFCGGSLYTLSKLLIFTPNKQWLSIIQGGYAGPSIVGEENVLKKFRGREQVPTWNLNLDMASTLDVMKAGNLTASFVSKNICHDAWVKSSDVSDVDGVFGRTLNNYFSGNKSDSKCMHDLLALMAAEESGLVRFLPVTLDHISGDRPKWFSTLDAQSKKQISVSFDKERFSSLIKNYTPKINVALAVEPTKVYEQDDRRSVSRKVR